MRRAGSQERAGHLRGGGGCSTRPPVIPVCGRCVWGRGAKAPRPFFVFSRGRGCPGRFRPVENLEKQAKKLGAPLHLS